MRIAAVMAGGLFCGLAGAHLSLVDSRLWVDGMAAGRGWIAVAMVTLSRWNALRAIAAALLFGAVEALIPQLLSRRISHAPICGKNADRGMASYGIGSTLKLYRGRGISRDEHGGGITR